MRAHRQDTSSSPSALFRIGLKLFGVTLLCTSSPAWALTEFSAFEITTQRIELRNSDTDDKDKDKDWDKDKDGDRRGGGVRLELRGTFTLGASSNGIDPTREPVAITLEDPAGRIIFTETLPSGSFNRSRGGRKNRRFEAEGRDAGVLGQVRFDARGAGTYRFRLEGDRLPFGCCPPAETVILTIGDDAGTFDLLANQQVPIAAAQPTVVALEPVHLLIPTSETGLVIVRIENPDPAHETRVLLTSADPAIVSVPAEVILPPGAITGEVVVTGEAAGGPVAITASLNDSSATSEITVVDQPPAPVLAEPLAEGATLVGGTGLAGALVEVTVDGGVAGTALVEENGQFAAFLLGLQAGAVVQATQRLAGLVGAPSAPVTVQALPPAPILTTPLIEGTTIVSGTGVPDATTDVFIDDILAATGTVSITGGFTLVVPTFLAGQAVTATQTVAGVTSIPSAPLLVVMHPAPPVVATPLVAGALTVAGTGTLGATIVVFVDDTAVGSGTVSPAGTWTVTLASAFLVDQIVTATQTVAGITSAPSDPVTVVAPPPAPTMTTPLVAGSTMIAGTGVAGALIDLFVNDLLAGTATVGTTGTWTITLETPLAEGDTVQATQTLNDVTSDPSEVVTVVAPPPPPIIKTPAIAGSTSLTGTGTPDATVEVFIDGQGAGTTTASPTGTWTVALAAALEVGQVIQATQTVAAVSSALSDPVTVVAPPPAPTIEPPLVAGDATISGTGITGATIEVFIDAVSLETTAVNLDGRWSLPLGTALLEEGNVVTATQTVAGLTSPLSDAAAVGAAVLRDITITPSPGATIEQGQTLQFTAAGTFSDGTAQDPLPGVTWTCDTTTVATMNADGRATGVGAGTANIRASRDGIDATPTALTIKPGTPVIGTFTPTQGPIGTVVTINGQNFDSVPANNQVFFNGVAATVTAATTTTFTTAVPAGASTGPITVTTPGGSDTSAANFIVLVAPTITSFTPTTGRLGDLVTITGTGLDPTPSNNPVAIGGAAAPVQSASPTRLVVTVPAAAVTGVIAVTTASGTAQSATGFTVIAVTALTVTPDTATLPIGAGQPFRGTATFADQVTADVTTFVTWVSHNTAVATVGQNGITTGVATGEVSITGTLETFSGLGSIRVVDDPGIGALPPDPASVAPLLDQTVSTTMLDATSFLYTGANPIQTGVAAGTIELVRAAAVRGIVRDRDGFPIPGVTISILDHAEFGQTLSRADGRFDLAVNGGGSLTLRYKRAGFIPTQRQVQVPWQDYVTTPDVVLIPLDPNVTTVDLATATTIQVARGSVVTDADGTRQATLLVKPSTQATMTLRDGTTQPLTTLNLRATEFTIGDTGPAAMPADLPPASAYTYAVEYSVDEAIAAGASSVDFSEPVISYNEDFLGLPIGLPMPAGFYDAARGQWVASDSGLVIEIVSKTAGLADLDIDDVPGADSTAALAAVGIDDAERVTLASLYDPGTRLWRTPIPHLSPWDFNLGFSLFDLFVAEANPAPNQPEPDRNDEEDPCIQTGSIIQCENQTLGEMVPIVGTPFQLHYTSDGVRGRRDNFTLDIPLTDVGPPLSMTGITLDITIAGRTFHQDFATGANQSLVFVWDGRDAYGRLVQGRHLATGVLGYVYDALPYGSALRFGRGITNVGAASGGGGRIGLVPTRRAVVFTQQWRVPIGAWVPPHLGGWGLDVHHSYDPVGRTLYLGTGERRSAEGAGQIVETVVGTGVPGLSGDGGPAESAQLNGPRAAVMAPDGSAYIADTGNGLVRRVAPDGTITTVAGGGVDSNSEGIPATQAQLGTVTSLALGPDASLYLAEAAFTRVRRVDPDGTIRTVAGNKNNFCITDFSGSVILCGPEEIPATDPAVAIGRPGFLLTIDVADDATLYIADNYASRVWAVTTDGVLSRVAGAINAPLNTFPLGDGGSATLAKVAGPAGIAVARDGSFYVSSGQRVRKVDIDGRITTVAGTGAVGFNGDGFPATSARLFNPQGLAVDDEGTLYIADVTNRRIRRVNQEGIITTIAWDGTTAGFAGDGGLAVRAAFSDQLMRNLDVGPDGTLYIPDFGNHRIRRVLPAFQGLEPGDFIVPAEDSSELYVFNTFGRHLRTLDPLTAATQLTFNYASVSGLLNNVTDADGNITTIERDGSGTPTAIIASGGQRTELTLNANGFIASIANPANESFRFTYSAGGLLETLTDPRGNPKQYTYDDRGLLIREDDAAGGFLAFSRTTRDDGWDVVQTTAEGRMTTYTVDRLANGDKRRTVTQPSGLTTVSVEHQDGTTSIALPDGTVTSQIDGPDPRWGMQAPVVSLLTVQAPSGVTSTLTTTRSVTLTNPEDPLSLSGQTDTVTINGRTFTTIYDQVGRNWITTSPAGRSSTQALDAQGRVILQQIAGLESVAFTYDLLGRLSSISQGTAPEERTSALSYNANNELVAIEDPENRQLQFEYDQAGRIIKELLPTLEEILLSYDEHGNITSVTPPGRPAHTFTYTPVDLETNYNPPDAGFTSKNTQFTYNLDRQLELITRPDGQTIDLAYDAGGRLSTLTLPGPATLSYAYEPTTGNLVSITAPDGTLSYAYDGPLLTTATWNGTVAGSVSRTYDNNFRTTGQSVNGVKTVSFGYDSDSMLTSAGALTLSRDPQHGLITGTTLGTVTDTRSYNPFGEIETYTANVGGVPVLDVQFARDKLGRITQKVETIQAVTEVFDYVYDPVGRLAEVRKDGITIETYGYDANGNRTSFIDGSVSPAVAVIGTYDDQDRLLTYGDLQFAYTNNGDLLSKTNPTLSQSATFDYDVLGNLKGVTLPNGDLIEYAIDGQNRRVGKTVNGALVQGFLYQDQFNPIAELDGRGQVVSRFVYATKVNVPDYLVKDGVTYRIISDHLGSVHLVIDTTDGTIAQRIDYDAFGDILQDTNPGFQPFGFAGGLYDRDTGLTRFGARDYDAQTGRWTAKDQIRFAGGDANLYVYVNNNPLNFIDPFGLQVNNPGDAFGGILGPVMENMNRQVGFRFVDDLAKARREFERTLAPGETRDVLLVVDTISKDILGIVDGEILTVEGSSIVGFPIRVNGRDPDIPILPSPGIKPLKTQPCKQPSEP